MALTILLATGQQFREETTTMGTTITTLPPTHTEEDTGTLDRQVASEEAKGLRYAGEASSGAKVFIGHPGLPRTIGLVGEELQRAMDAAAKVPALRAELDALLGRKPRTKKGGAK